MLARKTFLTSFFTFVSLTIASSGSAEQAPLLTTNQLKQIEWVRDRALKTDLSHSLLESLTTEVGARMAGTPQDTLAVNWAVKKLKALGFTKVWTEPVIYNTWQRGAETAKILSPFPQSLHITTLGGSVATPKKGIQAKLIHFKTFKKLQQADPSQVKGKIVFISNQMQPSRDGSGYGKAVVARRSGASEAAQKGAVAILIRSIGTDSHRLPHTGLMKYQKDIKKIPAAALSNPDADQLVRILDRDKTVSIELNIGARQGKKFTSHNVIAELTGTTHPDELILMGGHLDSWDLGTGAIDDGAGVAITMAALKLIKDSKIKPRRSIRLILWANEEQGLIGAKAYARAHKKELKQHIAGAESDFGAGKIYQFLSLTSDKDKAFTTQMADLLAPLGIKRGNNESWPGPDLIPLYAQGMSVFKLAQDGSDYFDLHHTADDTFDKVDPQSMAQNVAAYVVYALMTAQYQGELTRPTEELNDDY